MLKSTALLSDATLITFTHAITSLTHIDSESDSSQPVTGGITFCGDITAINAGVLLAGKNLYQAL